METSPFKISKYVFFLYVMTTLFYKTITVYHQTKTLLPARLEIAKSQNKIITTFSLTQFIMRH